MRVWKKIIVVVALVILSGPAIAQETVEDARAARAEEVELRMREAQRQLEEVAQRIAELSSEQLARAGIFEQQWVIETDKLLLGITIGSDEGGEPVEGVEIMGITPGGAADEAGLRSGDIITAINSEFMTSDSGYEANRKLMDFMEGVEEGDVLDIDYLRDSNNGSVELVPQQGSNKSFRFAFGGPNALVPVHPIAPDASVFAWVSRSGGHGFGDMEMVELNEELGRYFGTDSGLLIIHAPEDNSFSLRDGDVIKSIDGRTPKDLHHAVRILSSYQSGETVNIEIMRDKKKQKLTIEVPDKRHSFLPRVPEAAPAAVIVPRVKVVRKVEKRT